MHGVLANAAAIVVGSLVGIACRHLISEALTKRSEQALGLCTVAIGIKMAIQSQHALMTILCVAVGGAVGYMLRVEARTESLAKKIQGRLKGFRDEKFAMGFSSASILYCTGSMAVIGSIQAGIDGNSEVLLAKSMLDGIFSITFAALYGLGVAFSAIPVLLYQGAIALLASHLKMLSAPAVLSEISGVGGVLLLMIGLNVAGIKKIPVGDYLPAMLLVIAAAPFVV